MSSDDTGESYDIEGAGTYSVDDEDQLQRDDTLVDRGVDDVLDEGYSPPDRPPAGLAFGTTAAEAARGETLAMRMAQEEPDPNLQFDDPLADRHDGEEPGQDYDPEADAFLDGREVGDERAGRLVAPDEGAHEDTEKDLVAGDVGIDSGAASAEEAAMHVIDEQDV